LIRTISAFTRHLARSRDSVKPQHDRWPQRPIRRASHHAPQVQNGLGDRARRNAAPQGSAMVLGARAQVSPPLRRSNHPSRTGRHGRTPSSVRSCSRGGSRRTSAGPSASPRGTLRHSGDTSRSGPLLAPTLRCRPVADRHERPKRKAPDRHAIESLRAEQRYRISVRAACRGLLRRGTGVKRAR